MTELESVLQASRPETTFGLEIAGVALRVQTNAALLDTRLRSYFAPYVVAEPPDPAGRVSLFMGTPVYDAARLVDIPRRASAAGIKEAFYDAADARVILKRRTGVVIYVAEPEHYVVGDLDANFNQAVNAVAMVFAKAMVRRGFVMLHASAVLGETGGIAFASSSGSGKSTLALMLVDRHQHLVTNDRLFIRATPGGTEMVGVPKRPRVNPGTLLHIPRLTALLTPDERRNYSPLTADQLWTLERKHDVDVDAIYGAGTVRLRGPLRVLFLLRWSQSGRGWSVQPASPDESAAALGQVVKAVGVYDITVPDQAARQAALLKAAEAISVYVVSGRTDVDRLVAFILERIAPPRAAGDS